MAVHSPLGARNRMFSDKKQKGRRKGNSTEVPRMTWWARSRGSWNACLTWWWGVTRGDKSFMQTTSGSGVAERGVKKERKDGWQWCTLGTKRRQERSGNNMWSMIPLLRWLIACVIMLEITSMQSSNYPTPFFFSLSFILQSKFTTHFTTKVVMWILQVCWKHEHTLIYNIDTTAISQTILQQKGLHLKLLQYPYITLFIFLVYWSYFHYFHTLQTKVYHILSFLHLYSYISYIKVCHIAYFITIK